MRSHRSRVVVVLFALPACGSAPAPAVAPVASVDVAPPAAPPETQFRGHVTFDAVALGTPSGENGLQEKQLQALTRDLVGCLRHEPPATFDDWLVARVNESGHVEGVASQRQLPAPVASCVTSAIQGLSFASGNAEAISLAFYAEPAPDHCKGDGCTLIPMPGGGPNDSPHPREEGTIGTLGDGSDNVVMLGTLSGPGVGDTFGAGGLGLTGVGEGAGGRGEGIGLGSIGTLGHGAGYGTGQGFGSGNGRLGGSHAKVPKIRMTGALTVAGRLPPEVIQRIVRQNFGRFRLCYEDGLSRNPTLEGNVNTQFIIDKQGDVVKVTDAKSDLADPKVVACVQKSFKGLSFPSPEGGIVSVTYPIHLEPGKDPPPPPIDTVGGVRFPALRPANIEKKLAAAGWRTMTVAGASADAPFVVFALPADTKTDPREQPDGVMSSILWQPATGRSDGVARDSEGYRLLFEGADAFALVSTTIDPRPANEEKKAD